ncbi:conjugal transfer protein [Verrucomicrobia bacterium LW23]|nr:conjugal transfer protein [Verrucomicrobia bacterium LW23]
MVRFDQPCCSSAGALRYFRDHMATKDYLSQNNRSELVWFGEGAKKLGLSGHVQSEAFDRLCNGRHPVTNDRLGMRENQKRRVCYFGQISAPKDVSIALYVGGDKRIESWWNEAVQETLREIESTTGTRVRKHGANETRETGNMVAAIVQHEASRSQDPQLHTHLCIMNLTYDAAEKRWKGVEPGGYYLHQSYFREVCYNKLASRMIQGGYQLERTRSLGFTIKGMPADARATFSKRRQEITEEAKRVGVHSQDALLRIAATSRAAKKAAELDELKEAWQTEAGPDDMRAIRSLIRTAEGSGNQPHRSRESESLGVAIDHVFERCSIIDKKGLLREALKVGRGHVNLPELKRQLQEFMESGFIEKIGSKITTRETLQLENKVTSWTLEAKELFPHGFGVVPQSISHLNDEQTLAVKQILGSRDRLVVLQGDAGTGKTTTLRAVVEGIQLSGHQVFACAPTSGAADVLRKELTPRADTLQQLLTNPELQWKVAGHTLIVDESGLVSMRQMAALFRLSEENGNRILLVGDTKQHSSVEAGDALRAVLKYGEPLVATLTQIQRQKIESFRLAVKKFAEGDAIGGLKQFSEMGAVHEIQSEEELMKRAAADYVQTLLRGKSCLAISPVWSEIRAFNAQVRAKLKDHQQLGDSEVNVYAFQSYQWTKAQISEASNYLPGDAIRFQKDAGSFSAGTTYSVVSLTGNLLIVEDSSGAQTPLDPKAVKGFDVGTQHKLAIAEGERLLLRENAKSVGVKNGDIVIVKSVDPNGRIVLNDGRSLPAGYRSFTYGYAVTSHSSQGKTVDNSILLMSQKGIAAANLQQAYVSLSRFREKQAIYVTDLDSGRQAIEQARSRQLVREVKQTMGI